MLVNIFYRDTDPPASVTEPSVMDVNESKPGRESDTKDAVQTILGAVSAAFVVLSLVAVSCWSVLEALIDLAVC